MKPRIYTDTSVIGGCEDEEFREHSRLLLDGFVRGKYTMVLSELTLREIENSPPPVRNVIRTVPDDSIETVMLSQDSEELARAYVREGAISRKMMADALHIAMATIARVDVLVSWNFKHIVNLQRIHAYNSVNMKLGYPQIEIRTPREVLDE